MSEPADAVDRFARGLGLILGANLLLFALGALVLSSMSRFTGPVEFCVAYFPLVSLAWNAMLCFLVRRAGGSLAVWGAATGTALIFMASSGCWYLVSTIDGG